MTARYSNRHLHYQANTVKDRHVLSASYPGLSVANDQRLEFQLKDLKTTLILLNHIVNAHNEGR
ncbi:hypothetical protein SAMN05421755_105713 [Nitrosomonas sp. Nm33]|nr:hypothetical protein SAMN05421755_105713 [Nitrosomonas sp. Nm33]